LEFSIHARQPRTVAFYASKISHFIAKREDSGT